MQKYISLFIILFISTFSFAQNRTRTSAKPETKKVADTIPQKTVIVTSAFTPTLKKSAKINFSAGTPLPDTDRPTLQY
ncbi:MAG: hypothetical protein ABIY35_00320, partial [Chitinophagaceae bacterium]